MYVGRDRAPDRGRHAAWLTHRVGHRGVERAPPSSMRCTARPAECVEQLLAHVATGVHRIILIPYRYRPDQVERIAKEVLPTAMSTRLHRRQQLRHGRELRPLDARRRRGGDAEHHLGQRRVRLPRRRSARHAQDGGAGPAARRRRRRAPRSARPHGLRAATDRNDPAGGQGHPPLPDRRPLRVREAAGTTLQHVKAHGIEYHLFEENLPLGRASGEHVVEIDARSS